MGIRRASWKRIGLVLGAAAMVVPAHAGLVAYWDMDEAAGATEALDQIGPADAVAGGDTWPTAGHPGAFGTSWYFDASNDCRLAVDASAGDNAAFVNLGFSGWSYSGWINTTSLDGADTVFSISDAAAGSEEAALRLTGGLANFLGRHNTNNHVDLTGTTNIADGEWHHLAVVSDASGTILYVDGDPEASSPDGVDIATFTTINSNVSVNFGANNDNSSGLQWEYLGYIDEFKVFDHKLSETEVEALAVPEPTAALLLAVLAAAALRRR